MVVDLQNLSDITREAVFSLMDRVDFRSEDGLNVGRVRFLDGYDLMRLIELLKGTKDTKEGFPQGKWATIQHLQGWLDSMVHREFAEKEVRDSSILLREDA